MDLASVVAALASVGVRVSGSAPNSSVQVDSSRACPPGLAGPEPSGTINDLGQHFHVHQVSRCLRMWTSVVVGGASMASQLTSWMGRTWGLVFGGACMLMIWWMSLAVGPVSGASCAAWTRGGEGRSSQRLEGGRRGVHGCDQDVFRQPFHHEVVFPLQVSGDGGFRL